MTNKRKKIIYWPKNILIAVILVCIISISGTHISQAETKIKNVKLFISAVGFTENDEPIIEVVSQNDNYDVNESIFDGGNQGDEAAQGPGIGIESPLASESLPASIIKPETSSLTSNVPPPITGMQNKIPLPVCEVEISTRDGYSFNTMEQKDIQINGLGGICTKAVRKDSGSTLLLTIQITGLDNITDEIDKTEFHSPGTAMWSEATGAFTYEVLLYKNLKRKGQMHITEGTSYDFSPIMNEPGNYHYKVYPVSKSGKRGRSVESSICHISEETVRPVVNRQIKNEKRYMYSDGLYPQNTWLEIEGDWYFFDEYGYKVKDRWQFWNCNWYYLGETGKMEDA